MQYRLAIYIEMVKMNGDHPSIDSNNDESFVVLERLTEEGQSCLAPVSIRASISNQPFPQESGLGDSAMTSVVSESPPDNPLLNMTSEDIQIKLQHLIKENESLKVTVQQHNLAMKQQYQTLKRWQDEMVKVHQTHKEKFEETRVYINKLTLENKELKKALAEKPTLESESNEANAKLLSENASLQQKVEELHEKLEIAFQKEMKLSQPSTKEADLNELVERLSKQLEAAERARRQLSIDNERLVAQQTRLHQQPLPSSIALLGDNTSQPAVQPLEQIKQYGQWLQQMVRVEEDMARGFASLESWMHLGVHGDASLEISELRKLLSQEQKLSTSRKEAIGEVRQYFQRLLSDYQSLYQDWQRIKQELCIKERDQAFEEAQIKGNAEKIDCLTSVTGVLRGQLVEKSEELDRKLSYIESLNSQIKKLQSENECIEILTAQVNVYKMDFEAERKSREELVGEKDRLGEDLMHLQRRNQQLIDELQKREVSPNNTVQRRSRHSPSPSQVGPQFGSRQGSEERSPPSQKFTCPNPDCGKWFKDYEPLERHVIQCLKLDD